jgi:hypothetical protein
MTFIGKQLFLAAGIMAAACFASTSALAGSKDHFGFGVEGFHDEYKEPSLDLTDKTNYGSVTAYYSREISKKTFFSLDGRASYGKDDYSSPSGTLSGTPQIEFDIRGRFGRTYPLWGGDISPYTGLGLRYFLDEGKGYVSSLGAQAYDRRIMQLYIPIGASFNFMTNSGWSITPQAEGDIMFFGTVDSRLTNVIGGGFLDPAYNDQRLGFGFRSELMFGKSMGSYSIQAGPFLRYWTVNKSNSTEYFDAVTNLPVGAVYEPKNNRTQVGVAVRVLW